MPVATVPKYERIKRWMIREIEQGRWAHGGLVPSESELLQRLDVSRPTLVRSLRDLAREGYVYRRQGKGTFVAKQWPGAKADAKASTNDHAVATSMPVFVSNYTAALSGDARKVLLRMMRGIQSVLAPAGINFGLHSTKDHEIRASTRQFIESVTPGTALIIEPSFNPPLRHELERTGWRVWCINEPLADGNCIFIDQEQAGYLATRYLLEHGRRRIALLNGPIDAYWGFEARFKGYRRALAQADVAFDEALSLQGAHVVDSEAGRAMMRQLLARDIDLDGVVGASDSKAIGAMAATEEAGSDLLERIAFVSIDNTLAGRIARPLPAVAMPFEELGRQAALCALQPIRAGGTPFYSQIQLKPTLVER